MLDRLRAANIVNDEDTNGAFRQLYSRRFSDPIFLETVARRQGYDDHCILAAPFRVAAQKRLMRSKGIPAYRSTDAWVQPGRPAS